MAVRGAAEFTPRDRVILDAAAEAFWEKGFHGVGMDALGARAGLSGPSLYRHFAGKDEILATLLNAAMDELLGATVPELDDPVADLDRALRHHIGFAIEQRHLVTLHRREVGNLVEPWAASFARRLGDHTRHWERLVAAVVPDRSVDEVAALTQAVLGTVFSVSGWPARARRVGDADAVATLLLALVHRGLRGGLSAT